jgi:hypothetical protein
MSHRVEENFGNSGKAGKAAKLRSISRRRFSKDRSISAQPDLQNGVIPVSEDFCGFLVLVILFL